MFYLFFGSISPRGRRRIVQLHTFIFVDGLNRRGDDLTDDLRRISLQMRADILQTYRDVSLQSGQTTHQRMIALFVVRSGIVNIHGCLGLPKIEKIVFLMADVEGEGRSKRGTTYFVR